MTQREDLKGAEQMLHLALKLAQELQNIDAITYIYDLLANIAFSQREFDKAEKLFLEVMRRVLINGLAKDDPKVIHMSLKLAKIYQEKKDYLKAEDGFKYCLENLEKIGLNSNDEDILQLWAMSIDWYARFLQERNRLDEAFNNYKKAYDLCLNVNGEIHEQTVILLNDLGTISFLMGDKENAILYLTKAVEAGKHLPNMEELSSVYVNLGTIYMQQKLYVEAKKSCKEGWKNAKRHNNEEGMKEASICLEEMRNITG
uniref:MalT-like TPR region domain-containing protein n=2 Tax=Clastoptera arizonana TaxID=38151 RepID=A0A1B6D5M8_9HEMI